MAFLDWSDSLSVGIRLVDTDHKRLMDLINKLHESAKNTADIKSGFAALAELIDYTKTHFIHEETLMRKTAYPQYIPHKIEHDRLLKQIEDMQKKLAAGQVGLSQEATVFLRTWLCDHILKVDIHLGKWLQKYEPQSK